MNEADTRSIQEILVKLERMDIKGISIDSRTVREGELFVAIRGDRFDGHDFVADAIKRGAWGAVVERSSLETRYGTLSGMKNIFPVEDTLLSLQEMAMTHRRKFSVPLVGVTGSNGKTTTKEMTACILKEKGAVLKNEGNLNNHIGVPLTLLRLNKGHKSAVIEMGMSGLQRLRGSPGPTWG
jgi:UDP-N-acetylmuramyl pentapeptide synthase